MAEYYRILLSQKDEYISLNFENACAKVKERMTVLEHFFGPHNLTSDSESVDRLFVQVNTMTLAEYAQSLMNIPSSGGSMNTTPPSYKLYVKKEPISARIAVPTVYGHLEHEPTKHLISVYSKIEWFKRLMLRWCFGLRYVKHDNRTK